MTLAELYAIVQDRTTPDEEVERALEDIAIIEAAMAFSD